MSNRFSNGDFDDGWTWLWCVVWATVVQVALITFCFIVRNVQSMAVFLVYLYLPGCIVVEGAHHPLMSASAVWILFFLSVAFYSVLFGSLVYFGHRYIRFLRSNEEDRPHTPLSENEPENRESQGETSSAFPSIEYEGKMKWGCCVSLLIVLQPLLILFCLLDDGVLNSLFMRYVNQPAEWLLPPHSSGNVELFPFLLFLLLVVGTFYSVVIGSVFYFVRWLIEIVFNKRQHRGEDNVDSVPDRRSGER